MVFIFLSHKHLRGTLEIQNTEVLGRTRGTKKGGKP